MRSVIASFPPVLTISLMFLLACEEQVDWDIEIEREKGLVVEAILTDEYKTQEIRLHQSHHGLNEDPIGITDATVSVKANQTEYVFLPDTTHPGTYLSDIPFAAQSRLIYTLNIRWQDSSYTATSQLSQVAPIPEIKFVGDSTSDNLSLANIGSIFHPTQQAMYEVNIDWAHIQAEEPNKAKVYYYTFNSIHINEFVRPNREKVFFPRGSIIFVRKFGLNDDFADYLRSMLIETEWNGNFYYSIPENLPTNLEPEAFGFFSTCAVLTDTLIAE